jgi:hypothetical protein
MKGTVRGVRKWTALLASGAIVLEATMAEAADHAPEGDTEIVAKERPSSRSFYGWQILATGEAGGVLAAAATVLPGSPFKTLPSTMGFLVGMPFYVLGGPATHWTHGEFNKGLISLSANFALPVVGGLIGQTVGCAPSDAPEDCGARGFFAGFAMALVTVPLADALVLGWEDIPDDEAAAKGGELAANDSASAPRRSRAKRVARFTMTPAWSLGPRGELAFGVAGRF